MWAAEAAGGGARVGVLDASLVELVYEAPTSISDWSR